MYHHLQHYALDSKRRRAELFGAIAKKRGDFQRQLPKKRDDCALCIQTCRGQRFVGNWRNCVSINYAVKDADRH
jgi:hypothetical protein